MKPLLVAAALILTASSIFAGQPSVIVVFGGLASMILTGKAAA